MSDSRSRRSRASGSQARYCVASNAVRQVSGRLRQPLSLEPANFERHYQTRLALPYPVLTNLNAFQIALFEEQSTSPMGVDLEMQSTRCYPYHTTAAHVLGHLQRDDSSVEGEEAFFWFRLPDYRGSVGVEFGFDRELRGMAGAKSVLVNNIGYRQTENVWSPAEPGENVVLTIDLRIQQAVERALQVYGPATRGAAVVMDVHTGDILAMASSPTFSPNAYLPSLSRAESERIAELQAEKNRATQENYQPGSIFKTVVGLACLEAGLNPNATIYNPGYIDIGKKRIHDLAPAGTYDFQRALKASCNTYFITNGLRVAGISNIVKLAQRLHFGEGDGPAHAAGGQRHFSEPEASPRTMVRRRHRQYLHWAGAAGGDADPDGGVDGGDCQWREGSMAAAGGADRAVRTPAPGAPLAMLSRPAGCGMNSG